MSERTTSGKIKNPLTLGGNGRWSTSSRPPQTAFVYDRKTIVLHWCTALLVGALWLLGQTIDDFPAGPWRVDARSVHISLGARGRGRPRHPRDVAQPRRGRASSGSDGEARSRWPLSAIGRFTRSSSSRSSWESRMHWHAATISSTCSRSPIFLTVIAIYANSSARLHGWVANTLVILVVGHALLALFHHYVLRDGVMRRMVPGARHARGAAGGR